MPLSNEDSAKIVSAVNAYSLGVDESIFPLDIKSKLGFDPVGPLLYPCSGSDVVYPIRMFPNVNEFVLVDEHSLFSSDDIQITLQEVSEVSKITNLSKGFGFFGAGYDFTHVNSIMQRQNEDLSFHIEGSAVGALLLLRLRKLCGMEIKSIHEEVEGGVYTIVGTIDGQEKTIHYVSHYFGEQTKAYDWLQSQTFAFQTLFVKAFAPSINDNIINSETFSQIRRLIKPEHGESFAVISEEDRSYTLNKGLPHLINPEKIRGIDKTPYDFGYGSRLVLGDYDALYPSYPQHLVEQHNYQIQQRAQQRAYAEILKKEEIARESKAHEAYLKMSPLERFNYLQSKGFIEIKNNTLVIKISQDKDFLSKINREGLADIFNVSKEMHINSLELIIDTPRSNTTYQNTATAVAEQLSEAGSHIHSLSIKAAEHIETSYLSAYSTETARALLMHGHNLSEIDVMVNDQGALEFTNAIKHLKDNGNLTKASIRPILNWKDETRQVVSEALVTVKTQSKKNITAQLLEAVNKAQQNYAEHYQNNSQNARGPNGWFSWFRHGEKGQINARLFKERIKNLCTAQENETIYSTLENLLSAHDTRYNRHSFASYLLDALSTVLKDNNKKELIAVNGIYNSIDSLLILKSNLCELLDLQSRVANSM